MRLTRPDRAFWMARDDRIDDSNSTAVQRDAQAE
jgi:hypothetical protein